MQQNEESNNRIFHNLSLENQLFGKIIQKSISF